MITFKSRTVLLTSLVFSGLSITAGASPLPAVTSCSALSDARDQQVCTLHKPGYTNQIVKIAANDTVNWSDILQDNTLYLIDSADSNGNRAYYQLPFNTSWPDNSALVGNRADILPEISVDLGGFSAVGGHYVITATEPTAQYHFANVEFDSRSAFIPASSDAPTPTSLPGNRPMGVLNFKGAGGVTAHNIKVVPDPADHSMGQSIRAVLLGCSHEQTTATVNRYTFIMSEFDLTAQPQSSNSIYNAAIRIENECDSSLTGHVELTLHDTKTVINQVASLSSGALLSVSTPPRANSVRLIDSTCNQVVNQNGQDISQDHMGTIGTATFGGYNTALQTAIVSGAIGLRNSTQAWGWIPPTDMASSSTGMMPTPGAVTPPPTMCPSDSTLSSGCYEAGFASLEFWQSRTGSDLSCQPVTSTTMAVGLTTSSSSAMMTSTPVTTMTTSLATTTGISSTPAAMTTSPATTMRTSSTSAMASPSPTNSPTPTLSLMPTVTSTPIHTSNSSINSAENSGGSLSSGSIAGISLGSLALYFQMAGQSLYWAGIHFNNVPTIYAGTIAGYGVPLLTKVIIHAIRSRVRGQAYNFKNVGLFGSSDTIAQ